MGRDAAGKDETLSREQSGSREFGQKQDQGQYKRIPGERTKNKIEDQDLESGKHPAEAGETVGFAPGGLPVLNPFEMKGKFRLSRAVKEMRPEQNQQQPQQRGEEE